MACPEALLGTPSPASCLHLFGLLEKLGKKTWVLPSGSPWLVGGPDSAQVSQRRTLVEVEVWLEGSACLAS